MKSLGRHIIAEYYDCDKRILDDIDAIEFHMKQAAYETGATIVNSSFHRFLPYGVSGVVIVSESHLTIHTWPEYGYAAVDLFTCGDHVDPWKAFAYLKKIFKSQRVHVVEHLRGKYDEVGIPENAPHKATVEESKKKEYAQSF
ncbi:adenosylmethionine decarboxylase [Fervidobacterium thailandense]|uniref:S-adenosylmethionine decarboxylase proenzyme n=1 Tax=Fervidobacterium thailandense TaxID=1008305 RepID=A0A1E3G219_9BACT|nr:adenosylmethionine decarboxylase [Fervidobacterium thailandense]ODN30170.1 S-adenosylmethionine decarboxylase proenzyme [Fervidobacterium thailandense]